MDHDPRALVVELLAANEVRTLCAATGADSAKVQNIRRDPRVSLTVGCGETDWSGLRGVSIAAHAQVLDSRSEIQRVARLVKRQFPSLADFSDPEHDRGWAFLRFVPRVISVIDYTRGFGHSVLAKL